jgi:hypothetical protein
MGVLGNPRHATAEKGHTYIAATVDKLAGVLAEIASFEGPIRAGESRGTPSSARSTS